jgi:uncharacterized zinc-type alcohol dehydrogenase-like protein
VGKVLKVGTSVSKFKVGDIAGIGCFVDSCRSCPSCQKGLEQYCNGGMTGTYNGIDKISGEPTYGGYSTCIVADENYVLHVDPFPATGKGSAIIMCRNYHLLPSSPLECRSWFQG